MLDLGWLLYFISARIRRLVACDLVAPRSSRRGSFHCAHARADRRACTHLPRVPFPVEQSPPTFQEIGRLADWPIIKLNRGRAKCGSSVIAYPILCIYKHITYIVNCPLYLVQIITAARLSLRKHFTGAVFSHKAIEIIARLCQASTVRRKSLVGHAWSNFL